MRTTITDNSVEKIEFCFDEDRAWLKVIDKAKAITTDLILLNKLEAQKVRDAIDKYLGGE